MEQNKNCDLVRDLLPSYIYKLTSVESNKLIEKHLSECNDCKRVFENMKSSEIRSEENKSKKYINFAKKYKNKLRTLKITLLLIFITILVIFSANTVRKMIIISDLSKKAQQYVTSDNFRYTISTSWNDGNLSKSVCFVLDDKIKDITYFIDNNGISKHTEIGNKIEESGNPEESIISLYSTYCYIEENNNEKILLTDSNFGGAISPSNLFYTENLWDLFKCALGSSIKGTSFMGKECYLIDNFKTNTCQLPLNNYYIDKETGLLIFINSSDMTVKKYEYEFNVVTEEDMIAPDNSQYKVMTHKEWFDWQYEQMLKEESIE